MSIEISCRDDIINLPDIKSLCSLKQQWSVNSDGRSLRHRDDYILLLLDHYDRIHGHVQPPPDPDAGLAEAIQLDTQNRGRLQEMYDEIKKYYDTLPVQFQSSLNTAYPDVVNNIAAKRKELESRELVILVAGEKGAGKSSFINLLLETDILPVSEIDGTQTICELRKSSNGLKEAICFFRREHAKETRPVEKIKIDNAKGIKELKKRIKDKDRDDESPYERIEIYMPLKKLEEGVVIVDSPGFGEHGRKSSQVERYLAKSFGAIYLVNTASAGGVNSGRLRDFLRFVVNSNGNCFNPAAAIFIGNKIDSVEARDLQEVKDTTALKLKQCYPGLKDSNIFFISVMEAMKMVTFNARTDDHQYLLQQGIQKLFHASFRNKLNAHYRYQSQILKRALVSVKVSRGIATTGRQKKLRKIDGITARMEALKQNASTTIHNLREDVQYEENKLYEYLVSSLRSRSFTERVFNITECATSSGDWRIVAQSANDIISDMISKEVDYCENEHQSVDGIKRRVLDKFVREFQVHEDQLKEIESTLLGGDVRTVKDLLKTLKKQATVREIWAKAKEAKSNGNKINSLGSIVSSAGGLSLSDRRVKEVCKCYSSSNQIKSMKSLVSIYIENIFNGTDLKIKTSNFVKRYAKGLDNVAKKIPGFINADAELIQNIKDKMEQTDHNLKEVFPKLIQTGTKLQGRLDLFFIENIMEMDFITEDINYSPTTDLLGKGSYSNVYQAKLLSHQPPRTVALKKRKEYLQENNVSDVILEDNTMRDLDHENIVRYYGAIVSKEKIRGKPRLYWIMVLEYCSGTLKDKIINENYDNPAKFECGSFVQMKKMEEMAEFVIQICQGLRYLHKKDMVHRDLKLENILIAKAKNGREIIKLTDVGLTKSIEDIGGTVVGSPAYMAPEVLLQTEIHNRKADIYSLAMVLWEMWYGVDAADHIKSQLIVTLEDEVKNGLRPSMSMEHKPPADWMNLIERCWDFDQTKRPDVGDVIYFFQNFEKRSTWM